MNNADKVNTRVRTALWNVLSEIANEVEVQPSEEREGVYQARIRVGRFMHAANVVWAGEGWPDDITRVLERHAGHPDSLVVAARGLSPGSLERLARRGMGWVDEAGSARLVLQSGLAVYTERPYSGYRPPAELAWTPAAVAVGEALLTTQDAAVRSLHAVTGVSLGRISRILQTFDNEGFTRKEPAQDQIQMVRRLVDREGLLRSWVPAVGKHQGPQWMLTRAERDPLTVFTQELVPLLGPTGSWALTGPAAAQLEAPYLTTVPTVHIYVDSKFPERLQRLQGGTGLVPVQQGARFEFWSATTTTLNLARPSTAQPASGIIIADLPRVYADLLALGGRYEEAGGHLREVTNLGW